jgi:hypothetical protein
MRITLFLLSILLGVVAFLQIRKAEAANTRATELETTLNATKADLEIERERVKDVKKDAERKIAQADTVVNSGNADAAEKQRLLAEAQTKVEELKQKSAELAVGDAESKKQAVELARLTEKVTQLESRLASANQELAANKMEIARLQQATARPAMGAAMDRPR